MHGGRIAAQCDEQVAQIAIGQRLAALDKTEQHGHALAARRVEALQQLPVAAGNRLGNGQIGIAPQRHEPG
ncbi:hypothetical protein D3C87_2114550 [compost metagenome]